MNSVGGLSGNRALVACHPRPDPTAHDVGDDRGRHPRQKLAVAVGQGLGALGLAVA